MDIKPRKVFNRIGLAVTITAILIEVLQLLLVFVTKKVAPDLVYSTWYSYILIGVSFYLIGFPIFYLMVRKLPEAIPSEKRKFTIGQFLIILVIGFAIMYIVNILTTVLLLLISLITKNPINNPIEDVISGSNWIWTLIFVGIIAPIVEELMFRGVIINKLIGYGDTVAIITSAILFGVFHGNFSQCFYATALGLVLGYLRTRSGSLKYSIILHMCINIVGGVLVPMIALENNNIVASMLMILFILLVITAGAILFALNVHRIKLQKGPLQLEKGTVFKTTCLNFGMISYIVLSLALMIYLLFV